jgi:hypothetical protein
MIRGRFGQSHRLLDVQQTVDHRASPRLLVLLMHEDEFAQMMRVTEAEIGEKGSEKRGRESFLMLLSVARGAAA